MSDIDDKLRKLFDSKDTGNKNDPNTTSANYDNINKKGLKKSGKAIDSIIEDDNNGFILENSENPILEKENTISKILNAIKDRYIEIFQDQFNEFHVTLKICNHVECVSFESNRFKNIIRKEYFDQEKQILSEDKLNGILKLIESQLMYNNEDIRKIELNLRVARLENDTAFYYDLTNQKWEFIKITTKGWNIIKDNEIPIFKRYVNNSSAQVYPSKKYDENIFSRFLKLFNLESKKDILLLSVYVISLFVPDIPKCILVISGAGGGAKTTTFEIIKNIVDPSSVDTFSFPKEIKDLIQTLAHHYVNFFDNVSSISEDVSDLLCRSVSGAGFNKRALYSNDEDFIYKFKRGIGVNGINLATTRADFLDRSLVIKLKRIDPKSRRKKEDVDRNFEELRPFVLGYILDVLAKVLKYRKDHNGEKILRCYPRMADFAEWGEIIARCIGYQNNEFIKAYDENIQAQNDEVIESSSVAEVLILFAKEMYKDYWEGTPTTLYKELTDIADQIKPELKRSNLWPKASNKLTSKINEVEPNLKEKGIEIITGQKDGEGNRVIKIRKLQKNIQSFDGEKIEIDYTDKEEQLFNPYIHRIGYSDNWECDKCILKGDIHFMKQHICV